MKKIAVLIMLLSCLACSQTRVKIYRGGLVQVVWRLSAEPDIAKYNLYTTFEADSSEGSEYITEWVVSATDTTCNVIINSPLKLGNGYYQLAAIDATGNESGRSNKALFSCVERRPGIPAIVRIRAL